MICPSCGSENIEGNDRCENCLTSFRDLDIPRPDAAEGLPRSVMSDKLSRLERESAIIVAADTPAIEVARQMKEQNSGCALVLDGPKLVGIFTEHDVLLKMFGKPNSDPKSNQRQNAAHDSRNALEAHDEAAPLIPVEGIPLTDMPFSDIPLEEIRAEEMLIEETLVEVEVAKFEAYEESVATADREHFRATLQVPVKDLMTSNPETLHEHESVAFALNKMSMGRYRHLPVEKDDGTYTVASIKSVLKYIAQEDW
ncbi:MAG: CBS domain-containing protein [Acidobacteriota bacterium]